MGGMGCGKLILAFVLPPLAVLDKGPMAILWTTVGTICFWVPGIVLAFIYNLQQRPPVVYIPPAPMYPPQYPPQQPPPPPPQWPPQQQP